MPHLHALWDVWKQIAHRLATFQSRLLLAVFYFLFLALPAFWFRLSQQTNQIQWIPQKNHPNLSTQY